MKFSRLLVPKILLWSTGNSAPVPEGSWPAVVAECFVTFVVDCEASEQWKTVSDWTAQPLNGIDNDHRTIGNTEKKGHSRRKKLGMSAPRLQTYCDASTSFREKDTPAATGRDA